MKIILIITLLLNIFDYYNTVYLIKLGAEEINLLMNYAISYHFFGLIKLILIPLLILFILKYNEVIKENTLSKAMILLCFISYSLVSLYHIYINLYLL